VAEAKEVQLTLAEPVPAVQVRGDEHHLRQVVRNLVDNALKFTSGSGQVRVVLTATRARPQAMLPQTMLPQAMLRVSDTGIGIEPEDLPKIFNRFFRADKARQREDRGGVGLGLSICKAIVEALGGAIAVESAPGKGTTFTVTIPSLG
jgi:signal transduction histidine kinase